MSPRRKLLLKRLILAGTVLTLLVIGEVYARTVVPPYKKFHLIYYPPEQGAIHQYDSQVGWLGRPGISRDYVGSRTIHVTHNAEGFRDVDHTKTGDRPRWLILGDSFVWGFDVEASERFTERIAAAHPEVEILNCGVSGYNTAQELLLYRHKVRTHRPDGVILLFGENDPPENKKSISVAGYAVPRFVVRPWGLRQDSDTVPEVVQADPARRSVLSWYRSHLWDYMRYKVDRFVTWFEPDPSPYLVAELKAAVDADHATLVVVIQGRNAAVLAKCLELGCPVIELWPKLDQAAAIRPVQYTGFGNHWTPWGHQVAADEIERLLRSRWGRSGDGGTPVARGEGVKVTR